MVSWYTLKLRFIEVLKVQVGGKQPTSSGFPGFPRTGRVSRRKTRMMTSTWRMNLIPSGWENWSDRGKGVVAMTNRGTRRPRHVSRPLGL